MTKHEAITIINSVIEELQMSAYEFSKRLGMQRPQGIYDVQNPKKENVKISKNLADKITEVFPQFNKSWLLTGDGSMLKSGYSSTSQTVHSSNSKTCDFSTSKTDDSILLDADDCMMFDATECSMLDDDSYSTSKPRSTSKRRSTHVINQDGNGIPYYDVDFIGGFDAVLNDQTINPEYYIDFKPYNGANCWVNVSGHSMEPSINHGDIVALKEIENWLDFLPFGEIYGIVTDEFRTIKIVSKGDSADTFTLIPLNKDPQYVQQEIPKRIIRKVFSVLGAVKKF